MIIIFQKIIDIFIFLECHKQLIRSRIISIFHESLCLLIRRFLNLLRGIAIVTCFCKCIPGSVPILRPPLRLSFSIASHWHLCLRVSVIPCFLKILNCLIPVLCFPLFQSFFIKRFIHPVESILAGFVVSRMSFFLLAILFIVLTDLIQIPVSVFRSGYL